MIQQIPQEIIDIYKKISDSGFEVYFVGGGVRDMLMKKKVNDWDLTTNATPQDILKIFPDAFYDNKFGTVGIPIGKVIEEQEHEGVVEITTFRTEKGYEDKRHPKTVEWGKSIEEDLARRDFTINAIAMRLQPEAVIASTFNSFSVNSAKQSQRDKKIATSYSPRNDKDYEIIDPFFGEKDLENKIIKAVGNPNERFKEDALRLLRAIRIATELSFVIEENTWKAIVADALLIKEISPERIKTELLRILASNYPYEGITMLKHSELLKYIMPELYEGIDLSQARPGRHHTEDVFTHNLLSLKLTPSNDPIVRFAALIHDIAKPRVASTDENGLVIFHNHEIVGTKMAREITDRLKFSKKEREKVVNLIRWHMFSVNEFITDAAIRRFIRRVGVENIKDMIDLRIGDRLGGGTQTAESWRLKKFKERVEEQLKPAPFSINDLAIDGNDIMKELNLKPGPKIGEILQKLFEEVDEDLSKNTREYLLQRIKELI
ncbi:MAG: HD domain-containing protein [bacterium]|nr:HD domain-containing protein [bacterium]